MYRLAAQESKMEGESCNDGYENKGKPIHNRMSSIEQGSQHIILIKNLMQIVSMAMVSSYTYQISALVVCQRYTYQPKHKISHYRVRTVA